MARNIERQLQFLNVLELHCDDHLAVDNFHTLAVKIPGLAKPIDIGAWCYTKKKRCNSLTESDIATCIYNNIELSSITSGRVKFVKGFLLWLITMKETVRSSSTIKTNFSQFIIFLKWCDNQSTDYLSSNSKIVQAYIDYTEYLIHRYSTNQLSINTAKGYQGVTRDALIINLRDDDNSIAKILSAYQINSSQLHTVHTKAPTLQIAAGNLKLLHKVFRSLSDFILEFKTFPLMLNLEHDSFCLFPMHDALSVPVSSGVGHYKGKPYKTNLAYNFEVGRLSTADEIVKIRSKQQAGKIRNYETLKTMRQAAHVLSQANSKHDHPSRVKVCNMAMSCFTMLFISATGMNLSQVSNLKIGHFVINADKTVSFFANKNRAGGKGVTFSIGKKIAVEFRKYLDLREQVIQTFEYANTDLVFFKLYVGRTRKIRMNFSNNLKSNLTSWFQFHDVIRAKEWRAFKTHHLVNKYGFIKAATIMQNRPSTVLRNYMSTPKNSEKPSISEFFESYSEILMANPDEELQDVSIGKCVSIGNPSPAQTAMPFDPNCKSPEGCLFCQNYRVHPDLTDLSKLLSFKQVLYEMRHHFQTTDETAQSYEPVIERIDQIVSTIKTSGKTSEHECSKVIREVELGTLSPFWRRKMEMMIDLGLA